MKLKICSGVSLLYFLLSSLSFSACAFGISPATGDQGMITPILLAVVGAVLVVLFVALSVLQKSRKAKADKEDKD